MHSPLYSVSIESNQPITFDSFGNEIRPHYFSFKTYKRVNIYAKPHRSTW